MRKINSLQALRAIALFGIILSHYGMKASWAYLGVSVFFVLSGFLCGVRGDKKDRLKNNKCKILDVMGALGRVRKIYPLHVITAGLVLLLQVALLIVKGGILDRIGFLIRDIFVNAFLVQSVVPDVSVVLSLNGVAWFLSSWFIISLFSPVLFRFATWLTKRKWIGIIAIIGILLLQLAVAAVVYEFAGDSEVYEWVTYYCPLFRAGDYLAGVLLGRVVGDRLDQGKATAEAVPAKITSTVLEAGVIAIPVLFYVFRPVIMQGRLATVLLNWTTVYLAMAVPLVYVFAVNRGLITRVLNNRVPVFLGDYSGYVFLIHYVIIIYTNAVLTHFGISASVPMKWGMLAGNMVISYIAAYLYSKLVQRIKPNGLYKD